MFTILMKTIVVGSVLLLPFMAAQPIQLDVSDWEKGLVIRSTDQVGMEMFLWFYEHNLFDAIERGMNTRQRLPASKVVDRDRKRAVLDLPSVRLTATVAADGVALQLEVKNESAYDWPEPAAIIPCLNPGLRENAPTRASQNPTMADPEHKRTYYMSPRGLLPLTDRSVHFNDSLRRTIDLLATDGVFSFNDRWPTASMNASAGILIRESADRKWVCGIAWDEFVTAQGHNPRDCMHVGVRVGPLRRGQTVTRRGKIYLFEGTREECLQRMLQEVVTASNSAGLTR